MGSIGTYFKKVWNFLWNDDSLLSWVVNIILAFVIIKFIVYPGLGLLLGTSHPVVAVVSESMEHKSSFENWWIGNEAWYEQNGITKQQFENFRLKNGFNKGDIMVLKGEKIGDIETGDVVVFQSNKPDPIIHRVVRKWENDRRIFIQTKGDNNPRPLQTSLIDETSISEEQVIGVAFFRIPFLGYIKIGFVALICYEPFQSFLKIFFKGIRCA